MARTKPTCMESRNIQYRRCNHNSDPCRPRVEWLGCGFGCCARWCGWPVRRGMLLGIRERWQLSRAKQSLQYLQVVRMKLICTVEQSLGVSPTSSCRRTRQGFSLGNDKAQERISCITKNIAEPTISMKLLRLLEVTFTQNYRISHSADIPSLMRLTG